MFIKNGNNHNSGSDQTEKMLQETISESIVSNENRNEINNTTEATNERKRSSSNAIPKKQVIPSWAPKKIGNVDSKQKSRDKSNKDIDCNIEYNSDQLPTPSISDVYYPIPSHIDDVNNFEQIDQERNQNNIFMKLLLIDKYEFDHLNRFYKFVISCITWLTQFPIAITLSLLYQ